ncbi:FtsX-like permease family protein [Bifidobacterium sp. ESL0732]|uniref:ABC transporter permease n=1 Tax=Bifidobacterium sp. ESL0732 TaxID=2983222 RepID=UPI0023F63634|nr:FtsX-like permease family protein [Bifidobacterium sp. ESL0732]WEV64614.1 FtsX-like permease family protein [Bifidobacterium sp. ESL0732]
MFSVTLKLMKKSGKMLIPAGIAILIGTAFIAATFLFGSSMNDSLRTQLTAQFGQANYIIAPADELKAQTTDSDSDMKTVDDLKLDHIRSIDGVTGATASISSEAEFSHRDKHVSGITTTTSSDPKLILVSIAQGRQPSAADEIALPRGIAQKLGVVIGDQISVNGKTSSQQGAQTSGGQNHSVKVVGLTDDPRGAFSFYGGGAVVSDNITARLNGVPSFGKIPAFAILLSIDPAKADMAVKAIKTDLPHYYTIDSRAKIGDDAMKAMSATSTTPVTMFLTAFGILAMLVAALVIANTFQVMVAQRRRTLALLRTIGATKGQLYRSVLFEATLLGLIASALGIAAGIGLMQLMCSTKFIGGDGAQMRLVLSWQAFVIPLIFGVVMTVLASLTSARSATSVTPLEALRPMELADDRRRAGRVRAAIGVLMLILGAVMITFGASRMPKVMNDNVTNGNDKTYELALLGAVGGCALLFIGLAVTATFWMPVLMRGVGALVSHLGPSAKIADANIQKNPRRVSATGVALLIGVTLVSTIATGAACGKATLDTALDSRYSVDMVAEGSGLNQKTADKLAKVKGVSEALYAPTAVVQAKDSGHLNTPMLVVGVRSTQQLQRVMHADLGNVELGGDTAIIPKTSASTGTKLDVAGGTVTLTPQSEDQGGNTAKSANVNGSTDAKHPGSSAARSFTVRQVDYRSISKNYAAVAFVDIAHFNDGSLPATGHIQLMEFGNTVGSGQHSDSLVDVFEKAQSVIGDSGTVMLSGPIAERQQWDRSIDQIMTLLVALLAVAVLIALIGVANTLSLSVIERTRESATLRAIGMTRGQLKRSLACEALLISLVSGVAGVVLGTAFGWLGSYMVFSLYGKTAYLFDWKFNGAVLLIAALAALVSSIFPARRAVKTPPVAALAEA